jgi:chorismate mutase / prephenate dehydratase
MDLGDWRSRISDLDNQILSLLNQRAEAALQIGDLKRRQDAPSYVPEREAAILNRLAEASRGPLPAQAVIAVWREIVSACRALESPLTVAYLAPQGTFTHQAARERFGESAAYHGSRTIADVFEDVERGRAQIGVVPVENSIDGAVNVTLDRLVETELQICGELTLEIAQHLLSRARGLGEVKRVLSHPQGLGQCRSWLAANLPDVPVEETTSTAAAAELAATDAAVAAIASDLAGRLYNVPVLRPHIEDNRQNTTRFLVLGRQPSGPSGSRDKTSIVFAMPNTPGALYRILEPLAREGLNLTKIESRPARRAPTWDFVMFVDLEGHRETPVVDNALNEMAQRTLFLKVLGSYPAA